MIEKHNDEIIHDYFSKQRMNLYQLIFMNLKKKFNALFYFLKHVYKPASMPEKAISTRSFFVRLVCACFKFLVQAVQHASRRAELAVKTVSLESRLEPYLSLVVFCKSDSLVSPVVQSSSSPVHRLYAKILITYCFVSY